MELLPPPHSPQKVKRGRESFKEQKRKTAERWTGFQTPSGSLVEIRAGASGLEDVGERRELCTNPLRIRRRVSATGKYSLSRPLSRKRSADLPFPSPGWTVEAARALLPWYEPHCV